MVNLACLNLNRIEDSIVLGGHDFPHDNGRKVWVNALLKHIDCKFDQVEYGADIEQYSFYWNKHLYFLTISDTLESVWINASHSESSAIDKLYLELIRKF